MRQEEWAAGCTQQCGLISETVEQTKPDEKDDNVYDFIYAQIQKQQNWDFPRGPVVKNPYFHCRGKKRSRTQNSHFHNGGYFVVLGMEKNILRCQEYSISWSGWSYYEYMRELLWYKYFQFASCPSGKYGIWFYCYYNPPTISLWLLFLCLWM